MTAKQGPSVVKLSGDLDVFLKSKLQSELQRLSENGVLILDLTEVRFIDSAGLTVLVDAHKRATRTGGAVRLILKEDQQVYRILQITGLTRLFRIFQDEASAIAG
jgi:anti-sigma B factor antagonist